MDQFDGFSRILANRRITALISAFYMNDLTDQSRQILSAQLTGVPVTVIAGRLNMTSTHVSGKLKVCQFGGNGSRIVCHLPA